MAQEIEHKFLVKDTRYREFTQGTHYRQGYIPTLNGMTVRVRIAGSQAFVTFKDHAIGLTRHEFEYSIPMADALQLLDLMCSKPQIEKTRYVIPAGTGNNVDGSEVNGLHWEVDEFMGDNEGLILAEIEVPDEGCSFPIPDWIGNEVTGDHRYYNSSLCKYPYKEWKTNQ